MRQFLTERSLAVFLFVVALVVFSMASEDARNLEARNAHASGVQFAPAPPQVVEVTPRSTTAARD